MRRLRFVSCCFLLVGMISCTEPVSTNGPVAQSAEVPLPVKDVFEEEPVEAKTDGTKTAAGVPTVLLSREEWESGWVSLFDGQTLFGWKANSNANWAVRGGVISADQGDPGLLLTTFRLADYELRCDFRLEKGGNSGVFLRCGLEPKNPARDCYELNICDSHSEFSTGSFVARQKIESPIPTEGEWQTYHVRVEGNQVSVDLNGKHLIDMTDTAESPLTRGFVGLQMNGGRVEFRNLFLKPLGIKPIFNGKNLDGWRVVPDSKSEFSVVDGLIHVTNGRGFLETIATWKDFVFQSDVRTNGDFLNSGFFFRALVGTTEAPSQGYEFQIQNQTIDGDPTQPKDYGTGAIFNRVKARRIIAKDREWFTTTLIADGAHFSSWVNGYQVVDWSDTREPDKNPRKGKRLEAGRISIQGHDPTTDLDFRKLRVAEIRE